MPEKDLVYAAHLLCFSNEIASDVVRYTQQGKKVDYDVELTSNIQVKIKLDKQSKTEVVNYILREFLTPYR